MKPRFGAGQICDSSKTQSSGKVDIVGIFTRINSWGFPCTRNWSLVFSVFDITDSTTIIISLKKRRVKSQKTIATIDISKPEKKIDKLFNINIMHTFDSEGMYEIICSFKEHNGRLSIPFKVQFLEWPTFTNKEIKLVEKYKKSFPYKINVSINCENCSHIYIFEESILADEEPSGGAIRFPDDGHFTCSDCENTINLKDIQGRIRSSLKENLKILKKEN